MADRPAESAPDSRGRVLAELLRGKDEQLRITLDEYEGHPFLSIRVWARTRDGGWWPVRGKGVSVRVRELSDVASAIAEASTILDGGEPRPERKPGPRASTGRPTTRVAAPLATPADRPPRRGVPSDGDELPF